MQLCLGVMNCSAERLFSKATGVKNDLHASVHNARLKTLYLMIAEKELLRQVDYTDAIAHFLLQRQQNKF